MTIFAFEAQESWLPTVIGLNCSRVDLDDHDGTLSLVFNRADRRIDDELSEPERVISMAGVWRVEYDDGILAASGDMTDPDRTSHLDRLIGRELVRADVSHPGFDLALHLTGPYIVRCFPCDSAQFGHDPPDGNVFVSWWVDGIGVPDDWEEPHEEFFNQQD